MGTEKRERQKANRALRQQQEQKAESRSRFSRIALFGGIAVVAVIALVLIVNLFTSGDDEPAADTVPATEPASSDPATERDSAESDAEQAAANGEVVPDGCPPVDGTAEQTQEFDEAPPFCLDPELSYAAEVSTNLGDFTMALDQTKAPNSVNNFVFLSRNRFYDETECHRIIEGFVVQCGDPTASGTGGPGYQFADELPESGEYELGSVAMANSGPDTSGSQFFVVTGDDGAQLDPDYSLFGSVTSGFDGTVKAMEAAGVAGEPVEITKVVITTS